MNSTKERLAKAERNPLLVGIATAAKSPTQLDEAIKELNKSLKKLGIELTDEERKEAREIACQKRDKRKEFLASFGKALEKARIKEFVMDKKSREEALEKIKELREKFDIKDEELLSVTRIEKPTEQKIEERKNEAIKKGIARKAKFIAYQLGREREAIMPWLGQGPAYSFRRFRNSDLKIDAGGRWLEIYAKRKGKAFKRLVFECGILIEVYKPGKWEEKIGPLYTLACLRQSEKEKVKRDGQKQELVENFDL